MSGRMEFDPARVADLARDLAAAAEALSTASRSSTAVPGPRPEDGSGVPRWADALTRHRSGLAAVPTVLAALGDRARFVGGALDAAVTATVTQDVATARSVADAGGGPR